MIYLWVYGYVFISLVMGGYWISLWKEETNTKKSILLGLCWPFYLPWLLGCQIYSLSVSVNIFLRSK